MTHGLHLLLIPLAWGRKLIHPVVSWIDDDAFDKVIVAIRAEHLNYMFLVAKSGELSRTVIAFATCTVKPYAEMSNIVWLEARRPHTSRIAAGA